MSTSPVSKTHSLIIAKLRAAGCVFAEKEAQLLVSEAKRPTELALMVEQRVAGRRLEHILGWAEFWGLRIIVEPGVFVPRHRTEFLVQQAITLPQPAVVIDLCCGSGALGVAMAKELKPFELYCADLGASAVRCARRNVAALDGKVYKGDLFDPLPTALQGRADVIVANVPYVPTSDIGLLPVDARIHEPRVSFDGGTDGLTILRRVAAAASRWLAPSGHLLIETSEYQAPQAAAIFTRNGLTSRIASSHELNATVVIGTNSC